MTDPKWPEALVARAKEMWRDLCEKDDRTSPEDYPDMALITEDEFTYVFCTAALDASGLRESQDLAEERKVEYDEANQLAHDCNKMQDERDALGMQLARMRARWAAACEMGVEADKERDALQQRGRELVDVLTRYEDAIEHGEERAVCGGLWKEVRAALARARGET
jgi:alkylhydroperoxidase family enzyme